MSANMAFPPFSPARISFCKVAMNCAMRLRSSHSDTLNIPSSDSHRRAPNDEGTEPPGSVPAITATGPIIITSQLIVRSWRHIRKQNPGTWRALVSLISCSYVRGHSLGFLVSGVPRNFVRGGWTNSVEDRGQPERGSGGGSPLVSGSGGSCNLVQEISFL